MPRINNLPNATTLDLSDKVLGVVGGLAKNMTLTQLKSLIGTTVEDSLVSDSATNAVSVRQAKLLSDALVDKCPLVDGKVPSANLPSYVDDVLEYPNFASFPVTGEAGKIYVDISTDFVYRWSGSAYFQLGSSGSLANTDALAEGSTNLYFTESRVRNTLLTGIDLATNAAISAADSVLSALGKLQKQISDLISNQRYQFLNDSTTTQTTYTVPASAVTENGRTIIELSNNSLTSITINTATGTGKTSGDSVNISITGTYAAQALVASGVTLQGGLTFSYQYQTKTLVYKGSNTWKVVG